MLMCDCQGSLAPSDLANDRSGSFATGSSQQQVRPCPLCRRKRKQIQIISGPAKAPCRVDDTAVRVIRGPKPELRIMRYELSDYEWTAIKPMLPNKPRGVRRANDRRVLNNIFWIPRSGALWRDLPETYGPRTTCYNRFVRWRRAGVWDQIMETLAAGHDAAAQMIDTSGS
jgi:transposase